MGTTLLEDVGQYNLEIEAYDYSGQSRVITNFELIIEDGCDTYSSILLKQIALGEPIIYEIGTDAILIES